MTTAGAVLWVLRARFLRFEVRRFGTAMVRKLDEGAGAEYQEWFNFRSVFQRGSAFC